MVFCCVVRFYRFRIVLFSLSFFGVCIAYYAICMLSLTLFLLLLAHTTKTECARPRIENTSVCVACVCELNFVIAADASACCCFGRRIFSSRLFSTFLFRFLYSYVQMLCYVDWHLTFGVYTESVKASGPSMEEFVHRRRTNSELRLEKSTMRIAELLKCDYLLQTRHIRSHRFHLSTLLNADWSRKRHMHRYCHSISFRIKQKTARPLHNSFARITRLFRGFSLLIHKKHSITRSYRFFWHLVSIQ